MVTLAFGYPGPMQLAVILLIVLIIFGPKALPQLGRSLGRGLREFRQAADKATDLLSEDEEDRKPQKVERRAEAEPARKPAQEEPAQRENESPVKTESK